MEKEYDYEIIKKEHGWITAGCKICGNIIHVRTGDYNRRAFKHCYTTCQNNYFIGSPIKGDYVFNGGKKIIKKHSYIGITCKICGAEKWVETDQAQRCTYTHGVKNCGEEVYKEKIGEIIDDMEIVSYEGKSPANATPLYGCKCIKCKRIKVMQYSNLYVHKGTTHHACSANEGIINSQYMDNFRKRWADMISRTSNPNSDHYSSYGKRNINCDEFRVFADFYDAMYKSFIDHVEKYGLKNTTLERIDVDKNYCKENCKWTTWEEQFENKQDTVYFKVIDEQGNVSLKRNVSKYERDNNISHNAIYYRITKHIKNNTYNGKTYLPATKEEYLNSNPQQD